MNLHRFDLNLLKTLMVLYEERSVQRAAARLFITPSAVSHALSRQRRALADPLFVHTGSILVPTPRCSEIVATIRPLMNELARIVDPPVSEDGNPDPLTVAHTVNIVMPGALEPSLLPPLAAAMADRVPLWTLEVSTFDRRSYGVDLVTGAVDAVISVGGHTPQQGDLLIETLWHDETVAVQGPLGPLTGLDEVDLDTVLEWPQIYTVPWPKSQNFLDIVLAREDRSRPISVSMPSYAAAGEVLCSTTLVAVMPDRTAVALALRHEELQIVPIRPAIVTPLSVVFSKAFASSSAGSWFREMLFQVAKTVLRFRQDAPSPVATPTGWSRL